MFAHGLASKLEKSLESSPTDSAFDPFQTLLDLLN